MDIEFHYYMTYLIAARAGFGPAQATIVAQSSQEIDDNHVLIEVGAGTPFEYKSAISQTKNILRPRHDEQVFPIFHFIPGDPDAPTARRKDGGRSAWVTTPNSPLANEMLDTALRSGDLYRIGASAHAYADTWAHQNFLGRDHAHNEMPRNGGESVFDTLLDAIPVLRIGHALAGHKPDIPDLIWTDGRMAEPSVVNKDRFLDAARHLFRKLYGHKHGLDWGAEQEQAAASLVADLASDIGPPTRNSVPRDGRMQRYLARALTADYGSTAIPEYREGAWSDAAFVEKRGDIETKFAEFAADHAGALGDALSFGSRVQCTWIDPPRYRDTDWFKFQDAVKSHLDECWGVLRRRLPDIAG
ncbi:MAG: DUF6765 family protein [Rhizomicrobium sp.]|jgi:hypothetical protein